MNGKMKLELGIFLVKELQVGPRTELKAGVLYVNLRELQLLLCQDKRFADVKLELAHPGERCRIIHVLDVVEPRFKSTGKERPWYCGQGLTHVLRGIDVVVTGAFPGFAEGVIDMTGPGAEHSPFSRLHNLVIVPQPASGVNPVDYWEALTEAGIRAASYLGQASEGLVPEEVESYHLPPLSAVASSGIGLPRVAYICYLYSMADLRDMSLFGQNTRSLLPTIVHPNQILDGAIIYGGPNRPHKNTTYANTNNAVIRELYKRHSHSLYFVGVIVANHSDSYEAKERTAGLSAQLAASVLGAESAIITKDGGGQSDTDLMLCCEHCEEAGVKTVIVTTEGLGRDGTGIAALTDFSNEADAIVSTGIREESVCLSAMDRVIGGTSLLGRAAGDANKEIELQLSHIVGALSFLGYNNLGAGEIA